MTITQTNLAELYVSFFNRAPDSAGLAYWVDQLDKGVLSLEDISKNWMSEQAEGLAKYPVALTHTDFITQIYQATLGRAPDAEGLAYWQDQLTNNSVGRDVFLAAVINGAKANSSAQGVLDAATLSNKATAGVAFADKGLNDLTLAGQVVASVNSNPDTLAAAQALIKLVPATAASVTPALITLLSKTFDSIINLNAKAPGEVGDLATYLTAVANQASGTTDLSTLLTSVSTTVTNAATNSAALDNPATLAGEAVTAATPSTGGGGVTAIPSFTLTNGIAAHQAGLLPKLYKLTDTKADLGAHTVAEVVAATAAAQAVIDGASNKAGLVLEATYTLNDTLANVVGADSTLVSGHDVTLSDSSIDSTSLVSVLSKTTGLVDASAATNNLTVDFSAVTTNVNFKAGSGADLIKAGTGVDTLSGGAGTDTFAFAAGSNGAVFGQADVITDFVIGTDKLQFTNVTAVESTEQISVQSAVDALTAGSTAAQIASAMAIANKTDFGVSFATFEGNSYVLQEASGAADGVAANDVFIQLTGVTTAPTFAADVVVA